MPLASVPVTEPKKLVKPVEPAVVIHVNKKDAVDLNVTTKEKIEQIENNGSKSEVKGKTGNEKPETIKGKKKWIEEKVIKDATVV